MKKRVFTLFLCAVMMLSLSAPVSAHAVGEEDAQVLYELGLFRGVGTLADGSPDFALEKSLTRQEAVVMLVRLLGREQAALAGEWTTPFTDVDAWAQPYVGYAYSEGLTKGVSDTLFGGAQAVTATQYLTFALRALGYASDTDFRWDAAWEKTDALGITFGEYSTANNTSFLRGNAAAVSRSALTASCKDGTTLVDTLIASGALSQSAVDASGLMPDAYTLFARQLIAAGHDPVTVMPDKDGYIWSAVLPEEIGQYDIYMVFGDTVEDALVGALEEYAGNCLDGDYSDGYDGRPKSAPGWADGVWLFLLTDTKGGITAYGVKMPEQEDESFTMYYCSADSRPLIDPIVKQMKSIMKNIKKLDCTVAKADGNYIYTFAAIPENAVAYTLSHAGQSSSNDSLWFGLYTREAAIASLLGLSESICYYDPTRYPVTGTVITAPVRAKAEDWVKYDKYFLVFWDSADLPLAYAEIVIPFD